MVYINTTGKHNEVWLDKPYATLTAECPDCPSTDDAYESGYTSGRTDGYKDGYSSGKTDGYNDGWPQGYDSGRTDGYDDGWPEGYESGRTDGYDDGWQPGYDSGFTDGWNAGYVSGLTDGMALSGDTWEQGYQSGSTDGYTSGYTDGWNAGYASGRTDGYNEGKLDGIAEQLAKLESTAFTENGTYEREDGWNSVYVNVSGYNQSDLDQAYNSGITRQKSLLSSTSITRNGTYTRENGWSSVTVNVSGYNQTDLNNSYASGYTSGKTDGYDSGWTGGYLSGYTDGQNDCQGPGNITAITLNVPEKVINEGLATVSFEPSGAVGDFVFTSSDPNLATINSDGVITVVNSGMVQICVLDTISQLSDCKVIEVGFPVSVGGDITLWFYNSGSTDRLTTLSSSLFVDTVAEMYIDGEPVPKSYELFLSPGWHAVDYFLIPGYDIINGAFNQIEAVRAYITPSGKTLGAGSFAGCSNLTSVTLNNNVTNISGSAFLNCTALTEVNLDYENSPIGYIGYHAFCNCTSLSSFTIPEKYSMVIVEEAFLNSGLEYLTIPSNVDTIGGSAFANCTELHEVNIVDWGSFGTGLFSGCTSLEVVVLPEVSPSYSIPAYTFDGCHNLEAIGWGLGVVPACSFPHQVTGIGDGAFRNCRSLPYLDMNGSEIETIGKWAFEGCSKIRWVRFPGVIQFIDQAAFKNLTLCLKFVFQDDVPDLYEPSGANASLGAPGKAIRVPCYYEQSYKDASDFIIYVDYIKGYSEQIYNGNDPEYLDILFSECDKNWLRMDIGQDGTLVWEYYPNASGDSSVEQSIEYSTGFIVDERGLPIRSWNTLAPGQSLNVSSGNQIVFRNISHGYAGGIPGTTLQYSCMSFSGSTAAFSLGGNIMSLLIGDDCDDESKYPSSLPFFCFAGMFKGTNVVDASELVLPKFTGGFCYAELFRQSPYLLCAPTLPAEHATIGCYQRMYSGCTSLSSITCYLNETAIGNSTFWNDTTNGAISYWVKAVAQDGIFHRQSGSTWTTDTGGTRSTGMPSGWTVDNVPYWPTN